MNASRFSLLGGSGNAGSSCGVFFLYVSDNESWAYSNLGSASYIHTSATTYYSDNSHLFASRVIFFGEDWNGGSTSGMFILYMDNGTSSFANGNVGSMT